MVNRKDDLESEVHRENGAIDYCLARIKIDNQLMLVPESRRLPLPSTPTSPHSCGLDEGRQAGSPPFRLPAVIAGLICPGGRGDGGTTSPTCHPSFSSPSSPHPPS